MIIDKLINKNTNKIKCVKIYFTHNDILYCYKSYESATIRNYNFFVSVTRRRKINGKPHEFEEFYTYHPNQDFLNDFNFEYKRYMIERRKKILSNIFNNEILIYKEK